MKTQTQKGFAVGSVVGVTEDFISLFPSAANLRNVLCEVVDIRLQNGGYVHTIAPLCAKPWGLSVDMGRMAQGLFGEDLRAIPGVK